MSSKAIVFIGSSRLVYRCAQAALECYSGWRPVTVIETTRDKLKRNYREKFDILSFPEKQGIWDFLGSIGPAYVVSVNNPYLIPACLCERDELEMINLHHALLPAHPGRNAEAWSIFEGDEFAGVTWHYITPGIDDGDIIAQRRIPLDKRMTSLSLLRQCEPLALESFSSMLPLESLEGRTAAAQPPHNLRPRAGGDIPNGGLLDLSWPIEKMSAFLRSMDYGVLNVLGKPRVVYDGAEYLVAKYKILSESGNPAKAAAGKTCILANSATCRVRPQEGFGGGGERGLTTVIEIKSGHATITLTLRKSRPA